MDPETEYSYESIRADEIRLIRFTHDDGNFVSAVLETFAADAPPPRYRALSYTWNSSPEHTGPLKSWAVRVGARYLPVFDSLLPFVQALRWKGALLDGTWWWIDSICIDQMNTTERDEQVTRMKTTYQEAQNVVVWLGERSGDSDSALDFVQLLEKMNVDNYAINDLRRILGEPQYEPYWVALKSLFARKWWTRIWTVQEVVLPTEIAFWCGERHVSRNAVFAALTVIDRCNSTILDNQSVLFHQVFSRRRVWQLYKSRQRAGWEATLSLLSLVAYFCSNDATDDRDRLYGLTGLCTENHGIVIDYALSVEETYFRFAQSFMAQHKSLDILSFASLYPAVPGSSLPSWVPDWRRKHRPLVVPLMASQSSNYFIGNTRPANYNPYMTEDAPQRYIASGNSEFSYSFEGSTLLARGFEIDAIDGLAGSQSSEMVQSSQRYPQNIDVVDETELTDKTWGVFFSICKSLTLERRDRYLQSQIYSEHYFALMELWDRSVQEPSHIPEGDMEEFRSWIESTKFLRIEGKTLEDVLRACSTGSSKVVDALGYQIKLGHLTHWISRSHSLVIDPYIHDSFYGRFVDTVVRMSRRLMTTFGGRIGMAPQKAMKGDIICILYGCSIPMVLRRKWDKNEYTVIGECYLDGFMKGEALELEDVEERTFRIT